MSKIKKIISSLNIGQISKPIRTTSGFIILKIEDEKNFIVTTYQKLSYMRTGNETQLNILENIKISWDHLRKKCNLKLF